MDVVAGDNHGDTRNLAVAAQFLTSRGCHDAARLLTVENGRAILEDREMDGCPPVLLSAGLLGAPPAAHRSRLNRRQSSPQWCCGNATFAAVDKVLREVHEEPQVLVLQ